MEAIAIPFDFILLLLAIAGILVVIVLLGHACRRRHVNRLTDPRKDHYRR